MLVGRVDVGRERGDGQRRGRLRRRPPAFHAGESRDASSIARSRRRRRRACCAPSSPTRRAFACTIRCRLRRSSATKARPTTRALRPTSAQPGVELFVYGRRGLRRRRRRRRAIRRGRRAKRREAIARRHGLDPARDAVRAAAPGQHRRRRVPQRRRRRRRRHVPALPRARVRRPAGGARRACATAVGGAFSALVIRDDELPLADAVGTYLFNSQLLPLRRRSLAARRAGGMPRASRSVAPARPARRDGSPIAEVLTFDLRQSMRNGGGPACLRLRVPLTDDDRRAMRGERVPRCRARCGARRLDPPALSRPARPADLRDPALLDESRRALDELTGLLRLPSIYPFQLRGD